MNSGLGAFRGCVWPWTKQLTQTGNLINTQGERMREKAPFFSWPGWGGSGWSHRMSQRTCPENGPREAVLPCGRHSACFSNLGSSVISPHNFCSADSLSFILLTAFVLFCFHHELYHIVHITWKGRKSFCTVWKLIVTWTPAYSPFRNRNETLPNLKIPMSLLQVNPVELTFLAWFLC